MIKRNNQNENLHEIIWGVRDDSECQKFAIEGKRAFFMGDCSTLSTTMFGPQSVNENIKGGNLVRQNML